jgi:uncharacterized membrane-anchored protein YitT (DUF2179 family)
MTEKRMKMAGTAAKAVLIPLGAFIFACGVNGFFVPHRLLSTGVGGIGLLIDYLTGIPAALLVVGFNIPIFVAAWKMVSRRFFYLSLYGMAAFTFFLWLTTDWGFGIDNALLSAVSGGVMCGFGLGLMLRQGGSKGGVDIIAGILYKYFSLSYNTVSASINFCIIAVMAAVFGLEPALLTFGGIFTIGRVAEGMMSGFNKSITVLVLSRKRTHIASHVRDELGRRASVLQNIEDETRPKKILMFIVKSRELSRLKEIVFEEDDAAEISIIDTKEVRGAGSSRRGLY